MVGTVNVYYYVLCNENVLLFFNSFYQIFIIAFSLYGKILTLIELLLISGHDNILMFCKLWYIY